MGKIPTKINNISRKLSISIDSKRARNIYYTINEDTPDETDIHIKLSSEWHRPKKSEKIIDDSNEFENGFKVVQTENGEYAYVRESDNALLPFRYDVAFNFNQYGFAMVGKDGSVSWIDTTFKYLNLEGEFVKEELDKKYSIFSGWQEIREFSEGSIPLSRVYDGRGSYGKIAYLGIDGKFKVFYKYDGEINDHWSYSVFSKGTEFDENGYAMADDNMLFARGYYCSYKDLIKICKQKGVITSISEDAEKNFDKETGKVLRKIKNNEENQTK